MAPVPKSDGAGSPEKASLPRGPALALSIFFLTDALAQTVLFPFAPLMVKHFNVVADPKAYGYYAGYLASSAYVGSLLTNLMWGALSDHIGRRPILLMGLISNLVCGVLFGFSSSFRMAMAARFLNGFFSALGAAKTILAEISTNETQAEGFSIIGVNFGIGLLIGPALGGFLCLPTVKYPEFFPSGSIFEAYPFALPCIIVAASSVVGLVACWALLPETLRAPAEETQDSETAWLVESHAIDKKVASLRSMEDFMESAVALDETEMSEGRGRSWFEVSTTEGGHRQKKFLYPSQWGVLDIILRRETLLTIAIYNILGFTFTSYDEMFPLWLTSDWSSGGVGLGSNSVGLIQTAGGISLIPFQLLVYPTLASKLGTLRTLRLGLLGGMCLGAISLTRSISHNQRLLVLALTAVQMLRSTVSMCAFTSVFILVSNSAALPNHLGVINGIGQTGNSVWRALGPTLAGSLYAWCISQSISRLIDYHTPFLLTSSSLALAFVLSLFLPKSINNRRF